MITKAKLLFVDDEAQILLSLRALFRKRYQVFTAINAQQALEIIERETIHVVVSDQRMPNMSGHELLREIKQRSPDTMRLLLTGYSDLEAIMSSINEGEVYRFINKPWDNNEIRHLIDSAVHTAHNTMGQTTAAPVAELKANTTADNFFASKQFTSKQNNPAVTNNTNGSSKTTFENIDFGQNLAILVLDDNPEIATQIARLYPLEQQIHIAQNIENAIAILGEAEIAVIVCDIVVNGEDTTEFIKILKQQYPLIMTIVVTAAVDADTAIDLINQGQIFRYIQKPLSDAAFKQSLKHAQWIYQRNKNKPQLLQRNKVEAIAKTHSRTLRAKLAHSIKLLRKRFSFGI